MKFILKALIATGMSGFLWGASPMCAEDLDPAQVATIKNYVEQRERELFIESAEVNRLSVEVEKSLKELNNANWKVVETVALALTSGTATYLVSRYGFKLSSYGTTAWTGTISGAQLINIIVKVGQAANIRKAFNRLARDLAASKARLESDLTWIRQLRLSLPKSEQTDEDFNDEQPAPAPQAEAPADAGADAGAVVTDAPKG